LFLLMIWRPLFGIESELFYRDYLVSLFDPPASTSTVVL